MNGTLKMLRFNLRTVVPVVWGKLLIAALIIAALCMFFSPLLAIYMMFALPFLLLSPLNSMEKKGELGKLFGVLPVERSAVTRGRFLHLFLVNLVTELLTLVLILLSAQFRLQRFLPNQETEFVQMLVENVKEVPMIVTATVVVFACMVIVTLFQTTVGQIFGYDKMNRAMIFSFGGFFIVLFIFLMLSMNDVIPMIKFPEGKMSESTKILIYVILHFITIILTIICCEITTRIVTKREL